MQPLNPSDRQRDAWNRAITIAAMGTAFTLLLLKFAAWLLSGSVAVLGGLMDSGLDLVSSGVAFLAVRYAAQPPDENHRFGHQKAEALSALFQTAVITASASLVAVESIRRLTNPVAIEQSQFAIMALSLSVVLTSGLVALQTFAIRRTQSLVIQADRAHYLGDVFANAGILLAVILSTFWGLERADGVAGLIAAGFLLWSVKEVAAHALPQLMDEELPEEERQRIISVIRSDPGVHGFHNLRTRRAGARRFIQVDLEMPGSVHLAVAHDVSARVARAIREAFPGADVVVHQDVSDDREPGIQVAAANH